MKPLSDALRERTGEAHRRAEEATFITDLMSGSACRGAYAALARQHLEIYRAIEETIHTHYRGNPMIAPFADDRLARSEVLSSDLAELARQGEVFDDVLPATQAYADRLRRQHTAEMMLANHYVRYLGDLSGGQIVARMVGRHYRIDESGLSFYRFRGIDRIKPYRDAYRARLDALELSQEMRTRILDEAEIAFDSNRRVFLDLTATRLPEHSRLGIVS